MGLNIDLRKDLERAVVHSVPPPLALVLNFPSNLSQAEKEVEALLFAAAEPLDIETIQAKITKKSVNVIKILEKLKNIYSNRGINLVSISNKWSFRTPQNLSYLMTNQKTVEKKLSKAAIETLQLLFIINLSQEQKLKKSEVLHLVQTH